MAYRKASSRGQKFRGSKIHISKFRLSQVLPIYTPANGELNTAMFLSFMHRLGIDSFSSYLRKFAIPNSICALVGAGIGLAYSGISGLIVGALLGVATPAALIWLAVTLVHVAAYLAIFCLAWAVIFAVARWLLYSAS